MLHALHSDQVVGEVAQLGRLAAQRHHLEAQVLVEMDVQGREDLGVVAVPGADEAIADLALSVVVDQGETRDGFAPTDGPFLLDEATPDQVPDGFGAVPEPTLPEEAVEPIEERLLYRQADAFHLHGR